MKLIVLKKSDLCVHFRLDNQQVFNEHFSGIVSRGSRLLFFIIKLYQNDQIRKANCNQTNIFISFCSDRSSSIYFLGFLCFSLSEIDTHTHTHTNGHIQQPERDR